MSTRHLITSKLPTPSATARVGLIEHRLSGEPSPMVALAMTIPGGAKYSVGDNDYGQVAAAYKHALLRGTEGETKISFARKADLRPSPISSTLSQDLLTLRANFHINYLPEILETFKKLFLTRENFSSIINEFDLNGDIKEKVELDGNIGISSNSSSDNCSSNSISSNNCSSSSSISSNSISNSSSSISCSISNSDNCKTILLQAAHQLAFHSPNRLYFPTSPPIKLKDLDNFHQQTIERAAMSKTNFSFLISVNDSKLLNSNEFIETVKSCEIPIIKGVDEQEFSDSSIYFGGNCERIESVSGGNEFLISFPINLGGFNQQNYWNSLIFEALLKKSFPSVISSVTSNTSLLSIHLNNCESNYSQNKNILKGVFEKMKLISERVSDEELLWAQNRAKFNHSISIDSRENRLLTFAHHFAFSGNLNFPSSVDVSLKKLRASLNDTLNSKPTLVARGNPNQLIYYEDLL